MRISALIAIIVTPSLALADEGGEPIRLVVDAPCLTDEELATGVRELGTSLRIASLPVEALPTAPSASVERVSTPVQHAQRASAGVRPRTSPPIEDELTLLRRAKARVAAHDASSALEILATHAKAFPRSPMLEEATVLRIEALVATSDRESAKRVADAFHTRYPQSPYAQHVQSTLERLPR